MPQDPRQVSTAALAYLGDSVVELLVRERLVEKGLSDAGRLNAEALHYITASAQAAALKKILPLLDEEEAAVYRRGRNIGHSNVPKRATVAEYRMATGFEAVFGYLKLCGRYERMAELFVKAYNEGEETTNEQSED